MTTRRERPLTDGERDFLLWLLGQQINNSLIDESIPDHGLDGVWEFPVGGPLSPGQVVVFRRRAQTLHPGPPSRPDDVPIGFCVGPPSDDGRTRVCVRVPWR